MIRAGIMHPLSAILIILLAAPSGFAQNPPVPVTPGTTPGVTSGQAAPSQVTPTPQPVPQSLPGSALRIVPLEGNSTINSISSMTSIAPAVEIIDANEYPVEDASVTFTLPAQGPGGNFLQGGKTFSTRSDARGQAIAPAIIPVGAGKFKIVVTATQGDHKGEGILTQTNSEGAYSGQPRPPKPWYKKHLYWAIAGGVVVGVILVLVLHHSPSPTVVVTPGTPVLAP